MKKIEVIVKPFKLDAIKEALVELGIQGMTVSEVRELREGSCLTADDDFSENYQPRIKIEVVLADGLVEEAISAIQTGANSFGRNDAEILVEPVEKSIRIRTKETDQRGSPHAPGSGKGTR